MPEKTLDDAVEIVNFIKSRPKQSILFAIVFLVDDDGEKYVTKFLEMLHNENWLPQFAYLSDVFSTLNILNLTLQGKYIQDKKEANINKLGRWANKVKQSCFDGFTLLNDFLMICA